VIFHVHAKDTQIYERNLPLTGVLDTKPYTDERNRAWIFRTCGYGHGEQWWREFASRGKDLLKKRRGSAMAGPTRRSKLSG